MDHLDRMAHHIGVRVERSIPQVGQWAEYDATAHLIRLHPSLAHTQTVSTYAHELGHAMHRHRCSTPRTEREADHAAHWLTIGLCDFLRACQAHESMQAVAHELGVLPLDVRGYARRFLR